MLTKKIIDTYKIDERSFKIDKTPFKIDEIHIKTIKN